LGCKPLIDIPTLTTLLICTRLANVFKC
jgi:hypothetical protein